MANVVVVGSQWGDEGKGKIVDWLSQRADIVARCQGGRNARVKQVYTPHQVLGNAAAMGFGIIFNPVNGAIYRHVFVRQKGFHDVAAGRPPEIICSDIIIDVFRINTGRVRVLGVCVYLGNVCQVAGKLGGSPVKEDVNNLRLYRRRFKVYVVNE